MTHTTLASRVWTQDNSSALLRNGALMILGSLFIAIAAQINVPMQPVPMTLQTLAVLIVGGAFGLRLGVATLVLYIWEAAVGLPVLAEMKSGLAFLMGPTGGYILGFVIAAGLVGWFAERGFDRSTPKMLFVMLLGAAVIYIPGLIWLSGFVGGFDKAVTFGLAPFWLGDVVKAVIAALAFPLCWKLLGQR